MTVYLINAKKIREEVVRPMEEVFWRVGYWNRRGPIIYADDGSIMIFDTEEQIVHFIIGNSYLGHKITRQQELGGGFTDFYLALAPWNDTKVGQEVDPKIVDRLLKITLFHHETHQRIHRFFPRLN